MSSNARTLTATPPAIPTDAVGDRSGDTPSGASRGGPSLTMLGATIRTRRQELGLTLQAVAQAAGITKGYLSSIENERRSHPPSSELLTKIEWALRLPVGSLVQRGQWESTPEPVRRRVQSLETQRHLARRLALLLQRQGVDNLHRSGELRKLVERLGGREEDEGERGRGAGSPERLALPLQVPLINKVAAGYPTEFTDLGYPARTADEYVSVPDVSDPDAFAARVVGDSMEPTYRQGDVVVFSPAAPVRSGSDCFVRLERDDETTFKRVFFEGEESGSGAVRLRLQPLNPAYAPRTVEREAVAGMYAAVYVLRPVG